jgi:hypothetical protein
MLREGLHVWVLTLLAVVAIEQGRERFPWLRSASLRALLALRAVEVLAVAMVPTLVTGHRVVSAHFALTDVIAVLTMVSVCCWLGAQVWRARADDAPEPRPSAP